VVQETNLERLPVGISDYSGIDDSFSDSVYKELNADKHVYRHYRDKSGSQIDLYIGCYGTGKGGRTGHDPHGCLPGAGWKIPELKRVKVTSQTYANGVDIYYVLAQKGEIHESVFHWYQAGGNKILSSGIQ
jgi:EpsI family protein